MARLGGANEIVIADAEKPGHLAEGGGNAVGEFLRRNPCGARRLLDLLAVLVGARQELYPAPIEPHKSGERVAAEKREPCQAAARNADCEKPACKN